MTSPTTTRRYGLNSSAAIKVPCVAATTGNITLSGEQTIDGHACVSGDRVLVMNQTTSSQNGVYLCDIGSWVRDVDFDDNWDVLQGTLLTVLNGTLYSNTMWRVSTANPIVMGTTSLAFAAAVVNDSSSITFLQAGTGAVARTVQSKLREVVSVADFGTNSVPGTTNMTDAINAALATGKDVMVEGIMATTGLHRLGGTAVSIAAFPGQRLFGSSPDSGLKKLSTSIAWVTGTTYAVGKAVSNGGTFYHCIVAHTAGTFATDLAAGKWVSAGTSQYIIDCRNSYVGIYDLDFDCNSLAGEGIFWRGHYSELVNINITNVATPSYGLRISGSNVSWYRNIDVTGYGGILIDQTSDPVASPPSYGCLYSRFENLILAATGKECLKLAGSQCQGLEFETIYIENSFGNPSQAYPMISLGGGGPITSIHFKNVNSEYGVQGAALITVDGSGLNALVTDVHFDGGRISSGVNGHNFPVFSLVGDTGGGGRAALSNVSVRNIIFLEQLATANHIKIQLSYVTQGIFENNIYYGQTADGIFIDDVVGNSYITERNNGSSPDTTNWPGILTSVWRSATNVLIENSRVTQSGLTLLNSYALLGSSPSRHNQEYAGSITVADDASYDIAGDGGTSTSGDFYGIIIIGTHGSAAADKNNAAVFYAQVSSGGAGTNLHTDISVGSNVEILDNAANTAAALATTTDGKLGVQIGFATTGKRYIRIYNRTGASIDLHVHAIRF